MTTSAVTMRCRRADITLSGHIVNQSYARDVLPRHAPLIFLLLSACASGQGAPPSAQQATPAPVPSGAPQADVATADGGAPDDDDPPENAGPQKPGTLDRVAARRELRSVRLSIRENCARFLDPDLHADIVFDPATGKVKSVTLDSDRLGGVGTCVKEKLATITVPPFAGDGTMHVTLSPPPKATKKVPRAF